MRSPSSRSSRSAPAPAPPRRSSPPPSDPTGWSASSPEAGRPDLAGEALADVRAPVLLIVGGNDPVVRQLNEDAARRLSSPVDLRIVPGATHLFEEPGTLDEVIGHVLEVLDRWLPRG